MGRGYAGALMFVPAFLGSILVSTLKSHNKVGLLFSYWISSMHPPVCHGEQNSDVMLLSLCLHSICDSAWMDRLDYLRSHEE